MPPLGGVRPHHNRKVPLYPSEAPRPPGGSGVGVIAGFEANRPKGANHDLPAGIQPKDEGVDAFFHRERIEFGGISGLGVRPGPARPGSLEVACSPRR